MAVLRKFKAWRPQKGLESKVASYPYDVLNTDEARELVQGNPYSFLHVVKPEVDLPVGTDLYSQEVYDKARENFERFKSEGILIQEEVPRIYIYRQTMGTREQFGIVGCVWVDDYDNDVIKKHEYTRPVKEKDRITHVDVTNANAGPIFLTYKAQKPIDAMVVRIVDNAPVYDFEAEDGIGHTLWIVEDDDVADALLAEFASLDYLYVADGHHRSASAAKVANKRKGKNPNHTGDEEYNFFLAVLFPDYQLTIMDYNRVLKNLHGHSSEELFQALGENFAVEKIGTESYKPQQKGKIGMYMEGNWYKLTIKSKRVDFDDP
ncbi:MAG: DUF1015 family protein, partial [Candidatus Aminicenantes bacterium]|nr:DUF1015 family protein [Candidatus Aminicenantes bacterium]